MSKRDRTDLLDFGEQKSNQPIRFVIFVSLGTRERT